ncbi:MAG: hypothetical protein IMZ61_11595, partial [Planctomycetes bacterium]|nr:hypothetical protein [Planctomycetota bacterium]
HLLKQLIIKHGQVRHMEALDALNGAIARRAKREQRLALGYVTVGIYGDNQQPWMAIVDKADSPRDAALKAIEITYNNGENGVEKEDIFVIEVIKGRAARGVLGNDKILNLKDLQ